MARHRMVISGPGRSYDLLLMVALVGLTTIIAWAVPSSPLLMYLTLLPVFFAPGYAIQAALFPGRNSLPSGSVQVLERLMLSIFLSMAVVTFSGILLAGGIYGITLIDITGQAISLELLLITFVATFLAIARRNDLPEEESVVLEFDLPIKKLNRAERAVLALCIVGLLIASGYGIMQTFEEHDLEPYTEFALYGTDGTLEGLPQEARAGENASLIIAVLNAMNQGMNYTLLISLDENASQSSETPILWNEVNVLEPGSPIYSTFDLQDRERFQSQFDFGIRDIGDHKIYFILKSDAGDTELWLWIRIQP